MEGLKRELAEIDENLVRNELSALERCEHIARRKELYEELHPETKHGGERLLKQKQDPDSGSCPPAFIDDIAGKTGRSRAVISEEAKIGRDLAPEVKQALREIPYVAGNKGALAAIASESPEKQREIVACGEKEILSAAKAIRERNRENRRQQRLEKLAEISKGNTSLEQPQRFPVIYADPPWRYEHSESESRAIENQYPTMDLEAICELNVADISTKDAILFLWATSPKLAESMRVIDSWGYNYRTCAVCAYSEPFRSRIPRQGDH